MQNILLFILFYILVFFLGRASSNALLRFLNIRDSSEAQKIFGISFYIFYPLIGLFFLGNYALIVNFFNGIANVYYLSSVLLFIVYFNLKPLRIFENKNLLFLKFIIVPSILSLSSLQIGFARDAGGYHLNYQNWIRTEQMTYGLYLLNPQYGFTSILDYINANFWINNNMILLHYVNLTFLVVIFTAILQLITTNSNKKAISFLVTFIIFGILDNFGKNGGKNGFIEIDSVPKQDTAYSVIAIILFFFFLDIFISRIKDEKGFIISDIELLILFIFVTFAIQLRTLGVTFLLLMVILLIDKRINLFTKKNINLIVLFTCFNLFWFTKNMLLTGCLIFPLNYTCIENLPWSNKELIEFASLDLLKYWHGGYELANFNKWLDVWLENSINSTFIYNFILSSTVIFIVLSLFFKVNTKLLTKEWLGLFLFLLINFSLWITTAPSPRLGNSIFLSFILLFSYVLYPKVSFFENLLIKRLMMLFTILVVIGMPRLSNYQEITREPFSYNFLTAQKIEYIKKTDSSVYGVNSKDGVTCLINIKCVNFGREAFLKDTTFFYSFFTYK